MLVVKREIVKFKMFLVKRRKAIEKMIKEKEYMRDWRGSRESGENLIESKNGLN